MAKAIPTKVVTGAPKVGGYIHVAPLGTALPTDETTALGAGWIDLGYLSADGVKPEESTSTEDIRDWNQDVVLNADGEPTIKRSFTLISALDADVQRFIHGAANVTVTAATPTAPEKIAVKNTGAGIPEVMVCFDMMFGSRITREVFSIVKPTLTGITEYEKTKPRGYQIEMAALRDSAGYFSYTYTSDGVKTA